MLTPSRLEIGSHNTRRQTVMRKSIDERSHEAISANLKHRGIGVLKEN